MKPDIYEQLRKHLDEHPIPLPATRSGVELKLLKSLFNQEEAAIALQLSALLERPAKIQERFKRDYISLVELESKLYCLFQKGAIRE
jgi:electron transport complex protein RnfB